MDWQRYKGRHVYTTKKPIIAKNYWAGGDGKDVPIPAGTKIYLMVRMYMNYYYSTSPINPDDQKMEDWFSLFDKDMKDCEFHSIEGEKE